MLADSAFYYFIRIATYPLSWMPHLWLHCLGKCLGTLAFYCMRTYRKRVLSNLALAKELSLSPQGLLRTAKLSFQNLAINCLEYPRFGRTRSLSPAIQCENPEIAQSLYQKGVGIIFFCGHQSNWEVLFLDGTSRMKGVAIGKSIKNKKLYSWIVSIREKCGGKIIEPRNALREGLKALRQGIFLGIVGDQGMPASGYSFPFLGRRAWTSTAPALLSYKTGAPMIFAATRRVRGGYRIRYSDPIWPDLSQPMESEIARLMDRALSLLQESIKNSPGEWLWQHNRWKQQTPKNLYKRFRHDCLCLILPEEEKKLWAIAPHLPTLRTIYPLDFLFLIAPAHLCHIPLIKADETFYYSHLSETLLPDFRFKLVFNFTNYRPIHSHYKKLSAFEVLDLPSLERLASPHLPASLQKDLSEILKRALCRPGSLWSPHAP